MKWNQIKNCGGKSEKQQRNGSDGSLKLNVTKKTNEN